MKIKTIKELTFPELVVLYNNGELPYGEYVYENNDTKYSVSFNSLGIKVAEVTHGVDDHIKLFPTIPNHIKFKVTTEVEITKDTVLDKVFCLIQGSVSGTHVITQTDKTINDCIDIYLDAYNIELLSISVIQDNKLITIWKDGELIK